MRNVILIGMMGSGKTTCGRLLARELGRRFADTDKMIEAREATSIADIFARQGEAYFRDAETLVTVGLSFQENLVIATGGGLPLRSENMAALRENGVVVFLDRPTTEIFRAVSMEGRPLGQGGEANFLETYAQREGQYRAAADLTVTCFSSPEETVNEILSKLGEVGITP